MLTASVPEVGIQIYSSCKRVIILTKYELFLAKKIT